MLVPEFATSITCPTCHCRLKDEKSIAAGSERVLRYKRCEHCDVVWDRDLVGASNILYVALHMLVHGERPVSCCIGGRAPSRRRLQPFIGAVPPSVDGACLTLTHTHTPRGALRARTHSVRLL